MTEPPGRQRPIGFWLKLVDGLIDASFDEVLAADHVGRRHWQVLDMITRGAATPAELDARVAPFLSAAAPSVEPVIDDLLACGWLAEDGDVLRVSDAGREAHVRLRAAVATTRERLTAGLTAEQYTAAVGVLRQMALNLGWADR